MTAVLRISEGVLHIVTPEPHLVPGGVFSTLVTFPLTPSATVSVSITLASFPPPGVARKGLIVRVVTLKKRSINQSRAWILVFTNYHGGWVDPPWRTRLSPPQHSMQRGCYVLSTSSDSCITQKADKHTWL